MEKQTPVSKAQQLAKLSFGQLCFSFPMIPVAGFVVALCSRRLPYGSFHLTRSVSSVLIR